MVGVEGRDPGRIAPVDCMSICTVTGNCERRSDSRAIVARSILVSFRDRAVSTIRSQVSLSRCSEKGWQSVLDLQKR